MLLRLSLISVCVISLLSTRLSADAGFTGLGNLSVSDPSGQVYGMSEDGKIVVGSSYTNEKDDEQAYRWNEVDGMIGLGWLTEHNVSYSDRVSGDGLTIIGSGLHRSVEDSDAQFIWTQATGIQALDVGGKVTAISFDGSVLAGEMDHVTGRNEAFRRSGGTSVGLGFLETPDADSNSNVGDISSDGSVIVGSSTSAEGGGAYRWTLANGMVSVDPLAGSAIAVSGAGDTIVGRVKGEYPYRVYIWTEATGANTLFDPGPNSLVDATDISADGTTVVGVENNQDTGYKYGWRWTSAGGLQTIKEWLTEAGVDSTGWTFPQAYAVSADGTMVSGYARNPSGDLESFIAWVIKDLTFADGFE